MPGAVLGNGGTEINRAQVHPLAPGKKRANIRIVSFRKGGKKTAGQE